MLSRTTFCHPEIKTMVAGMCLLAMLTGCIDSEQALKDAEADHLEAAKTYREQGQLRSSLSELTKALEINENNPETLFQIAQSLLDVGDPKSAERQIKKAIDLGLKSSEANFIYVRALQTQSKYDEALAMLETLPESDKQSERFQVANAELKASKQDFGAAKEIFTQLYQSNPENIQVLLGLSKLAMAADDRAVAEQYAAAAAAVEEDNIDVLIWQGQLAMRFKEFETAQDYFDKALLKIGTPDVMTGKKYFVMQSMETVLRAQNKHQQADFYAASLEKSGPGQLNKMLEQANVSAQTGDFASAEQTYQAILSALPDHEASRLGLGLLKLRQGELESAEKYLSELVESNNSPVQARLALAMTQMRMNQHEKARNILEKTYSEMPNNPDVKGTLGAVLLSTGDNARGEMLLKETLQGFPEKSSLAISLAQYYLNEEKIEEAIQVLEGAVPGDKGPEQKVRMLLMKTHLSRNDKEAADAVLQAWLNEDPTNPKVHNAAGALAVSLKQGDAAQQHFSDALQLDSKDITAVVNLARLEQSKGRFAEAYQYYEQALDIDSQNPAALTGLIVTARETGDIEKGLNKIGAIMQAEPEAIPVRLVLANYYLQDKQYDKAIQYAKEAYQINQTASGAARVLAIAHYETARVALENKDYEKAESELEEVLTLEPGSMNARALKIALEVARDNDVEAIRLINEIKEMNADVAHIGYELEGNLHAQRERFDAALEAYQRSWGMQKTWGVAMKIHTLLNRMERGEAALEPFQEWVAEKPEDAKGLKTLAIAYQGRGMQKEAIDTYEKLQTLDSSDAITLNNLAWLYYETGDDRAAELAKKAYEMQPKSAAIADTYGWILVQTGNVKDGIEILKKAVELAPDVKEISDHLKAAQAK